MDAVITYVDGLDPVWQRQYAEAIHRPALSKRYRDWGLLPYLLRGIEQFMPFVERVFLVVSTKSQVPSWVNEEQLKIVYHHDIIPSQFLPTFNSTTIELFLHRIPDLSNEFIYFNDDCFPVAPLQPTNFFTDGKIVMHFSRHYLALNMYKKQTRQSDHMARIGANLKPACSFIRPQHTCTPMLRTESEALYQKIGTLLEQNCSVLRTKLNANQYVFTDYLYYSRKTINERIPTKHCSMAVYSPERIANHILHPTRPLICINDVSMNKQKQEQMRLKLHQAFATRLPAKSRFEK